MEADYCYLALLGKNADIEIQNYQATAVNVATNINDVIAPFRSFLDAGTMAVGVPLVSRTSVVVALAGQEQPQGLLGCEVLGREQDWPTEKVDLMTTSAYIVSRVLENFDMLRALRENETFFKTLAVSSPCGIMRTDMVGNCFYINDRAATIFGQTADDCLGKGWLACIHSEDQDRVWQGWELALTTHASFKDEYRIRHSDGSELWVIGTAIPHYNEVGRVIGIVGTLTDITELKTTQAALRLTNDA
jgi:PAS domain S-box-containing protein